MLLLTQFSLFCSLDWVRIYERNIGSVPVSLFIICPLPVDHIECYISHFNSLFDHNHIQRIPYLFPMSVLVLVKLGSNLQHSSHCNKFEWHPENECIKFCSFPHTRVLMNATNESSLPTVFNTVTKLSFGRFNRKLWRVHLMRALLPRSPTIAHPPRLLVLRSLRVAEFAIRRG